VAVNPSYVEALRKLHGRSPEGMGLPLGTCAEVGLDEDDVRALRDQGYVEVIDDDGEPTLVVTDAGRELLRP
jgi:hypothetical protein